MSLRDINIKKEYRSSTSDVVNEFYVPALSNAILYRRAVGFFSSTALIELSRGIFDLIKNDGRIELIVSPRLSEEDIDAINQGYSSREKHEIVESILMKTFISAERKFDKDRLNLIYTLISTKRLDIKIAVYNVNSNYGLYHEKMGLIYDKESNVIAFTGSMNESITAFSHNYETIDIFTSWTLENDRVKVKEKAFLSIWNNKENNLETYDFTKAVEKILKPYSYDSEIYNIDKLEYPVEIILDPIKEKYRKNNNHPQMPDSVKLYDYQLEAIKKWKENNYRGIFDMATGTGKTITALYSIHQLFRSTNKLFVIIVCPYQHLVEQWVEDLLEFNVKPIIGYSSSIQHDWKIRLARAVRMFNENNSNFNCIITTNSTYNKKYTIDLLSNISDNVLFIVDEAHNMGTSKSLVNLLNNYNYRLALSATIDRKYDEEGTEEIKEYFGGVVYKVTIDEAINKYHCLVEYEYHPVICFLDDEEFEKYKELTHIISKNTYKDRNGKIIMRNIAKIKSLERARLIAIMKDKLRKLNENKELIINTKNNLIYCGAASYENDGINNEPELLEIRQVDLIRDYFLDNGVNISKFTADEDINTRIKIKENFKDGIIESIVAIKCLDEGVNIPSIERAFILASSKDEKQYIQRRGRVLRKFQKEGYEKEKAFIYDFVALPFYGDNNKENNDLHVGLGLVKSELERMKKFYDTCMNKIEVNEIIEEIRITYGIEGD